MNHSNLLKRNTSIKFGVLIGLFCTSFIKLILSFPKVLGSTYYDKRSASVHRQHLAITAIDSSGGKQRGSPKVVLGGRHVVQQPLPNREPSSPIESPPPLVQDLAQMPSK